MKHGDSDYKKVLYFLNLVISVNAIFLLIFLSFFPFISTEFWSTLWKSCCSCCRSHSECKRKGKSIPVHSVEDSSDSCEKKFRLGAFLDNSYLWHCDKLHVCVLYSCETCICPGKRHLPNNTGTALKRVFAQENAIYPAILVHVFIFVFVFVFFFDRRLL